MLSDSARKCTFFTVSDCKSPIFLHITELIHGRIHAAVTQADMFSYNGKTLVIAYIPSEITTESDDFPAGAGFVS